MDILQVAYQSIEPGPNVPGVKGNPLCNSTYEGYILWFSSASNKEIFDANPSKYMPNVSDCKAVSRKELSPLKPLEI